MHLSWAAIYHKNCKRLMMCTYRGSSNCSFPRRRDFRKPPGPTSFPTALLICTNTLSQLLINAGLEEERLASDGFSPNLHTIKTPSHAEAPYPTYSSPTTPNRPHPPSSTPSFRTQPNQYTSHSSQVPHSNGNGHSLYQGTEDPGDESDGTTKQDAQEPRRGGGNEYNDQIGGNRTLFFTRLPEKTTYASFLEVVRGGAVVDAWMKPSDRCASISFLHPQSAEAFYKYAKKNDLYVDGRRVSPT